METMRLRHVPRPWVVVALVLAAVVSGALVVPSAGAMPSSGGGTGGSGVPSVQYASYASCAAMFAPCTVHPALGDPSTTKYLVIAFVHGPTGQPGTVVDSQRDLFHLVTSCWLDNGIFGHTAIFEANATVRASANYTVSATPGTGTEAYLEVVLVFNTAAAVRTDAISNTCVNHWTRPTHRTLSGTFTTPLSGDLAIYLWVMGQANGSSVPVSCGLGTATILSCGTDISGPSYEKGLSFPGLARASFSTAGTETATITLKGGGSAHAPCPWDVSYVALTSDPPPAGGY